jgi:Relaxase/Mobilisation nuclease domain
MLAKSIRGSGFAGVINYAYKGELDNRKADEKKAEVIHHSDNIRIPRDANDSKGIQRLIADFIRQSEKKETPLKETVGHHIISFNTSDTDKLSNDLLKKITSNYIKERGLKNTQYVAIRHHDTEHQHLHIIFNRVDNDGKTLDSNNYFDNSLVSYDLSIKYGLSQPAKQKQYIENIQRNDPNFRENLKNRASAKIKEKSKETNIHLLKEDELLKNARNLHHLSKLCEAESKSFTKTDDGFVLIDNKKYKQDDLEAVFLLNREEAKVKKDVNGTPSISQRDPKAPDYQIKTQKIEERKMDAAFFTNIVAESANNSPSGHGEMEGKKANINVKKLDGLDEGEAKNNNFLDLGSDAFNNGRFKAMDDEEEKEKQRKIKRNRGMR